MQFNGKIDQLAFIAHNDIDEAKIMQRLGLADAAWIVDFCTAEGEVRGEPGTNEAKLMFNYDMGVEVEILRYLSGPNYAEDLPGGSICHFGVHTENAFLPTPTFNAPIVQRVKTIRHTNEFLLSTGRRYQYTIYDTVRDIGVYSKVIERLHA